MGIQLNIKSEEAYALASKIAEADGVSLTQAVIEGLRLRARELESEQRFNRALEIIHDMRARLSPEFLAQDFDAMLYDEDGLPK